MRAILPWLLEICVKKILDEIYSNQDLITELPGVWGIGTGLCNFILVLGRSNITVAQLRIP